MAKSAKAISWRHGLKAAVGAVVGAAVGYAGVKVGAHLLMPGLRPLQLLGDLALLPVAWLLVVGFHELGHLAGGWVGGGKFLLWAAGPFTIRRTPSGIRPAWNRSVNLAGGMAACLPLDPGRLTPGRMALMIAGGPAASLVLAGVMFGLAAVLAATPAPAPVALIYLQHGAIIAGGISSAVFLMTAVPGTMGGFKTDGRRFWELLQPGARAEQESALIALTAAGLAGMRPAEYPAELVAKAVSLGDGSLFDLYGHATVYYHAADRGDWRAAQEHLDYALQGEDSLVPHLRDVLRCEYAWLLATVAGDAAAARAWLDSAGKLDFEPATRLRAEAAVLLAEGRPAGAAERAREGLVALERRSLSPVRNPFGAGALGEILRRAEAKAEA